MLSNKLIPTSFRNDIESFRFASSLRYSSPSQDGSNSSNNNNLKTIQAIHLNTKQSIRQAEYLVEVATKSGNHKMIAELFKILEKKRSENSEGFKTDIFDQRKSFRKLDKMIKYAAQETNTATNSFWNSAQKLDLNHLKFNLISRNDLLKLGDNLSDDLECNDDIKSSDSFEDIGSMTAVLNLIWGADINLVISSTYENQDYPFLDGIKTSSEIEKYMEKGMNLLLDALQRGESIEEIIAISSADAFKIIMKSKN